MNKLEDAYFNDAHACYIRIRTIAYNWGSQSYYWDFEGEEYHLAKPLHSTYVNFYFRGKNGEWLEGSYYGDRFLRVFQNLLKEII